MRARLNLERTRTYELAVAANKVTSMLVPYVRGKSHILGIGSEQGGIPHWDDFVIEHAKNKIEYIQVKRQYTAFGSELDLPSRGNKRVANGAPPVKRDLSPLDKSMKSLGELFNDTGAIDNSTEKSFTVILPSLLVEIKTGLTANDLNNLCAVEMTTSTTLPQFRGLSSTASFSNIFEWLKSWCDFTSEAHIFQALKTFKIAQFGSETDINSRTIENLSVCYGEPERVLQEIVSYIQDNTSYTSFINPRHLAGHLRRYLLTGQHCWTQFKQNGFDWEITGTHGQATDEIEYPSAVVPALWSKPNKGVIKYHAQADATGKLPRVLVRLMLHMQPTSAAHIGNLSSWHLETKRLIGSTLGIDKDDCESLCTEEDTGPFTSSASRTLDSTRLHDEEATQLTAAMHSKTWSLVCDAIRQKIASAEVAEVRDAVEERWRSWQAQLDTDVAKQQQICQSMMHPNAEGMDIEAELRIGPKTASLIADGFYQLLVIAVCFDESSGDWATVGGQITMSVKALRFWSGPAGFTRKVRKLAEDGIEYLIGKEPAQILVLSEVGEAPETILESNLADVENDISSGSLASARQPTLLLTNSGKFSHLLRKGSIAQIREFLQTKYQKGKEAKTADGLE
jgi:hypothetical protein